MLLGIWCLKPHPSPWSSGTHCSQKYPATGSLFGLLLALGLELLLALGLALSLLLALWLGLSLTLELGLGLGCRPVLSR